MGAYVKRFATVVGVAIVLFPGPLLAQSQGSAEGLGATTALNWAGYIADTGTYTAVSGSWVVPDVSDAKYNGADATWVGIGGVVTPDLIQAGTEAVPDENGGIDYQAWYELLPDGAQVLPLSIRAGDSISASITELSTDGLWNITIRNNTTGKSYSRSVHYASTLSSADWIEEMPAGVGRRISLDDFGTVDFTNGLATVNGTAENIAQAGAAPLTMATQEGQEVAIPSTVGADGGSFSVTRTGAVSDAIGIGDFGTTFVSSADDSSSAAAPNDPVSYVDPSGYGSNRHHRYSRTYAYSTGDGSGGIIQIVIDGRYFSL